MAKQTFTAGQVLTATQVNALQANDYNQTVSTKTTSYVLVAGDVGTRIVMNSATDATITVNTSLFSAGDTLWIHNIGAGLCTVTAGTATVTTSSTLVIPTNGGGYLYFTSASSAIFFATGNIDTTQALSNRNVIINGAMQVAQRGTSQAGITTEGYYTADRFTPFISSLGTWTQSVENDAPTGSGFRKSLKMLCTTADASPAASDTCVMRQKFEGQNLQQFLKGTSAAKQWALSFWVKANVTGTFIVNLYDYNNNREVSAAYSISASATWEKKTITFPADTTGAFNNDNNVSLEIGFGCGAGSNYTSGTLNTVWSAANAANRSVGQTNVASAINNYWQITGVQLEAGAVATPFEFEDFGVTLTKCQRYYQRGIAATGAGNSASTIACVWSFPVTMRSTPTLSQSANLYMSDGTTDKVTSSASVTGLDGNTNMYVALVNNFSGLTANRPYIGPRNTATDGQFIFSAEL